MKLTTLCYIEQDEKYLMLYRNKKKNDLNEGKWIGVGGKFEENESPEECLLREVREETGLTLLSYHFYGVITFLSDQWEEEKMFLYTASEFTGELITCNEGELKWIPKKDIMNLSLWEGDKIFLQYLLDGVETFDLKVQYEGDKLILAEERMKVTEMSSQYQIRRLTPLNVEEILELCSANKMYYEYCPPFVTKEHILEDIRTTPPNKTMDDKYYLGFYQGKKLMAIMDLIDGYPEKRIAFIGFFMMDVSLQGQGVGTQIITEVCSHLKEIGMEAIRLCWVKGNPQAEQFWRKNQFIPIKETKSNVAAAVILAERSFIRV